jgi:hypothetical protein
MLILMNHQLTSGGLAPDAPTDPEFYPISCHKRRLNLVSRVK